MYLFRTLLLSALAVSPACCLLADTTQILQSEPTITHTGVWYPHYESGDIGGSATLAKIKDDKGAQAAITSTGIGITWIGVPDQCSGIAQMYPDGTSNTVDTYAPNTLYRQPLFAGHGLASGTHALSIRALHQRDGNTDGSPTAQSTRKSPALAAQLRPASGSGCTRFSVAS